MTPEESLGSLTLGCASLAPLKAVALRVRAARALGATTRVVRIAEGATTAAMFDGSLGDLSWPETRPLDQGIQAFKDLRNGAVTAPKIILQI